MELHCSILIYKQQKGVLYFVIYINQNYGRYSGFAIEVYQHWTKVFNINYYSIFGISSSFNSAISKPLKKIITFVVKPIIMKKLLLLSALFIFACSYGQTYEDIISIDSKEQFIRIGIENDYEVIEDNGNTVKLAFKPSKEKNGDVIAKGFARRYVIDDRASPTYASMFEFSFLRDDFFEKRKYDDIFSFVKKNLKFEKVVEKISLYTVDKKRAIGFYIDDEWCTVVFINIYK